MMPPQFAAPSVDLRALLHYIGQSSRLQSLQMQSYRAVQESDHCSAAIVGYRHQLFQCRLLVKLLSVPCTKDTCTTATRDGCHHMAMTEQSVPSGVLCTFTLWANKYRELKFNKVVKVDAPVACLVQMMCLRCDN